METSALFWLPAARARNRLSIGFTVLGALLLHVLQHIALANLPIIGKFLAELVRIMESNL